MFKVNNSNMFKFNNKETRTTSKIDITNEGVNISITTVEPSYISFTTGLLLTFSKSQS